MGDVLSLRWTKLYPKVFSGERKHCEKTKGKKRALYVRLQPHYSHVLPTAMRPLCVSPTTRKCISPQSVHVWATGACIVL